LPSSIAHECRKTIGNCHDILSQRRELPRPHHLWDRGGWTYLLPELLADLNTGHNIVATVFEECRSMYRANGPVEMRPVGEVEFVAGIAAMSASDGYGPIKVAQSIVGYADLALGDRVEPVLD
jgi:L-fuconolactonase